MVSPVAPCAGPAAPLPVAALVSPLRASGRVGTRYPLPNSPVRRPEEMGFALIAASASGSAAPARKASFFGSA